MKFHRNTIWLIPLFFIVTFPLWSIPVGNFLAPRTSADSTPNAAQSDSHKFNMNAVKILQNKDGKKTAIIHAQKAHTGEDPNLIIMEHANADLFDTEGNITHVVANTGKYNTVSKLLTLIGDVVVNKIRDDQFLYTDLLLYDSEKRTVKCPGKTRLEGKNVEINGGSLDYDVKTETYVIGKRVECTLNGFIQP